tara:strand:- start:4388 stop:8419 length:4032 start_codon:yes stop_codon:yes gene_type:complete
MSILNLKSKLDQHFSNLNLQPSGVKDKGTPLNLTAGSLTVLDKLIKLRLPELSNNLRISLFIDPFDRLKGQPTINLSIPPVEKKGQPLKLTIPELDKLKGMPTAKLYIPIPEKKGQPLNLSIPPIEKKGHDTPVSEFTPEKEGRSVNTSVPPIEKDGFDTFAPESSPLVSLTSDLTIVYTPQTFDDGRGNIVTGQQSFDRPSSKTLENMESKFAIQSEPGTRGPYGVTDYIDGTKQGRGFISPGGPPDGFTIDMETLEGDVVSSLAVDGDIALTPLSYTVAGMNSDLEYGVVSEQTFDDTPILETAWGSEFMVTPLQYYTSQFWPHDDSTSHSVTHLVDMITLSGPTVDPYQTSLDVTPKILDAHNNLVTPLSNYDGIYVDTDNSAKSITPSEYSLGEHTGISVLWADMTFPEADKTREVYQHHFLASPFAQIPLWTDLFGSDEAWKDGSIHIVDEDLEVDPNIVGDIKGAPHPDSIFHQLGLIAGTYDDPLGWDTEDGVGIPAGTTTLGNKNYRVYNSIDNVAFDHLQLQTNPFTTEIDWDGNTITVNGWKLGSVHIPPDITEPAAAWPDVDGLTPFSDLNALGLSSIYEDEDGNYIIPSNYEDILEEGQTQRTFNIPAAYPNNQYAYSIDTQFGFSWGARYIPADAFTGGEGQHTYNLNDNFEATTLAARFLSYNFNNPDWPYKGVGLKNFRPLPVSPEMKVPDTTGGHLLTFDITNPFTDVTSTHEWLAWSWTEEQPDTYQPYIRKEIGQRYGDPNPSSNAPHPRMVGIPIDYSDLMEERLVDDIIRIENWLKSPIGQKWVGNQSFLQGLNPRPETRSWSKSSIVNSLTPFFHDDRHAHGFAGDGRDYENYDPLLSGDMAKYGFGTRFGDGSSQDHKGKKGGAYEGRLWRLTEEFIVPQAAALEGGPGLFASLAGSLVGLVGSIFGGGATGMPPTTPSHDVKSQAGAFGSGPIHIKTHGDDRYASLPYEHLGTGGLAQYAESLKTSISEHDQIIKDYIPKADDPSYESTIEKVFGKVGLNAPVHVDKLKAWSTANFEAATAKRDKAVTDKAALEAVAVAIDEQTTNLGKILNTVDNAGSQKSLRTMSPSGWGGLLKLSTIDTDPDNTDYKTVATDNINMIPYGDDYSGTDKDFIKFKFYDVYNNKWIIFRAILSGISDTITPEWTGTRYIGRPDQVYVYNGADREVGFSFEIYPKTVQEFPMLIQKLNYLIGMCYPSFNVNRMVAPFINLTIGDMFVDTPGFLSSLSMDVDDMTTWEIENGRQFPKHITCNCSFTYIGKTLPSSLGKHYELDGIIDKGWQKDWGIKGGFKELDGKLERIKGSPDSDLELLHRSHGTAAGT